LTSTTNSAADAATENFADLLAESFGEGTNVEGSVVRGFVIGIEGDAVVIDVGLNLKAAFRLRNLPPPDNKPMCQSAMRLRFMSSVWKTAMVRPY
jgi:ribosomal protein S1